MRRTATIVALALTAALAVSAGPASASASTTVHCGETLTHSVKLANDLTNCPGDGLVIGASRITVDLAGHTIDGDAVIGGDDTGVRLDGRQHVTVRGGTIEEFDHAVHLTGARHNHITHLEATRSGDTDIGRAILLDSGSDDNLIDGNDASFNGRSGVAVLDSSAQRDHPQPHQPQRRRGHGRVRRRRQPGDRQRHDRQRRKRHLLGPATPAAGSPST